MLGPAALPTPAKIAASATIGTMPWPNRKNASAIEPPASTPTCSIRRRPNRVSARWPSTGLHTTRANAMTETTRPISLLGQAPVLQEQREEREEARDDDAEQHEQHLDRDGGADLEPQARPGISRCALPEYTAVSISDGRSTPEIAHRPCDGGPSVSYAKCSSAVSRNRKCTA